MERETLCMVQQNIDRILLIALKENDPIYAGEVGLTKKQHNK